MTPEHAFLQSMLETPDDLGPPLIFADWLEEHGDGHTAELLRLVVAEAATSHHSPQRLRRLGTLRDQLSQRLRVCGWSTISVGENNRAARFYRNLASDEPGWQYLAVCFERHLLRLAQVRLSGNYLSLTTREGQPLMSPQVGSFHPFDLLGEEKTLERADLSLTDLPTDLVVPLAWLLCEYLCNKQRQTRAGQIVPGTHFFAFCLGESAWRHADTLDNPQAGVAKSLLREQLQTQSLFGTTSPEGLTPIAAVIVRVSDQGNITADKLLWLCGNLVKESPDLPSHANATLAESSFRDALLDLKLNEVAAQALIVATPDRLRELFRSSDS